MEDVGVLDIDDVVHLFALYYVYLPHINMCLQQFAETWNHHPLGTASNLSPLQLWMTGEHPSSSPVQVQYVMQGTKFLFILFYHS